MEPMGLDSRKGPTSAMRLQTITSDGLVGTVAVQYASQAEGAGFKPARLKSASHQAANRYSFGWLVLCYRPGDYKHINPSQFNSGKDLALYFVQ